MDIANESKCPRFQVTYRFDLPLKRAIAAANDDDVRSRRCTADGFVDRLDRSTSSCATVDQDHWRIVESQCPAYALNIMRGRWRKLRTDRHRHLFNFCGFDAHVRQCLNRLFAHDEVSINKRGSPAAPERRKR